MENIQDVLHKALFIGIATLFLSDAVILFLRSRNNKPRKTLAYVILLWALVYVFRLLDFRLHLFMETYSLFRVNVLAIGSFFIMLMYLFPLQVLIPGWLNWKRAFYLFLPAITITGLYYVVLGFLGQSPEIISSYAQLKASFWHFNVWYRFVMLICNAVYIISMLKWLYRYEQRYLKWKNDNYSDLDYVDISWMHGYYTIIVLIMICYLFVLTLTGKWPVIVHSLVVMFSFSYLFYKGLFYRSPYPPNFFHHRQSATEDEKDDTPTEVYPVETLCAISEKSFDSKIPSYTQTLKIWLEEERPYLYKDFKLTDVSRVLPLNRSYLSRIFNEGFGMNFSETVRYYRIEHAKEMIQKNPALPLFEIADASGFNSDSTFVRAFKLVTGITPTQFKADLPQ